MWQEDYDALSSTEQNQFQDVANRLLQVNFLVKSKPSNTASYYFVESHYDLIREYFSFIRWNLEINRSIGVVSLKNSESRNRIKLRMNETIVLLILRLLYEQQTDEMDLYNHVEVQVADIHDLFAILGLEARILNRKMMNEVLSLFKRFNLIDAENVNTLNTNDKVLILPSILFAVETSNILDVYQRLQEFGSEEEQREETDED